MLMHIGRVHEISHAAGLLQGSRGLALAFAYLTADLRSKIDAEAVMLVRDKL